MYKITHNGVITGDAKIEKKGLFYYIYCRCSPPAAGTFRVSVTNAGKIYDLGICVPSNGEYTCLSRIPCKSFHGNEFIFTLVASAKIISVPIVSGRTFEYLESLNSACLQQANGLSEMIIDPIRGQQGSDRNPVRQNI